MNTEIKILGRTFVTDDALTVGDYGGAGSVGYANKKWLYSQIKQDRIVDLYMSTLTGTKKGLAFDKTKFFNGEYKKDRISLLRMIKEIRSAKMIRFYGGYGSESFYVAKNDPELLEAVEALENYPCFDDQIVSEIELEWQNEFIASELNSIENKVQVKLENDEIVITEDQVWDVVSELDESGGFFAYEYSGAFCDIDQIVEKICTQLKDSQA